MNTVFEFTGHAMTSVIVRVKNVNIVGRNTSTSFFVLVDGITRTISYDLISTFTVSLSLLLASRLVVRESQVEGG